MSKSGRGIGPNLIQKKFITGAHLDWKDWLVVKETAEELKIVSKGTGKTRTIKKRPTTGK